MSVDILKNVHTKPIMYGYCAHALSNPYFKLYKSTVILFYPHMQIKGSSGLLSKITFTGEDADFLTRRMQALEVMYIVGCIDTLPDLHVHVCNTIVDDNQVGLWGTKGGIPP